MDTTLVLVGIVALLVSLHLYNVRAMRYTIRDRTVREHGSSSLTPLAAQRIVSSISHYEFPFMYGKSLEFALFKTYGIPSIAKVLASSYNLVDKAGIRAEDTALLIEEITTWNLNSERSTTALARMNQLHAAYGDRITNDDLLYTLSAFILEPVNWINRYEWRDLSTVEADASFTMWVAIGQRMGIVDMPETFEELRQWSEAYEQKHMVFHPKNKLVADATVEVFLRPVPHLLKGVARLAVYALMEDRVRLAFGYPQGPLWIKAPIFSILWIRRVALRHLALPRARPDLRLEERPNAAGRYHPSRFRFVPLYVRPGWWNKLICAYLGFESLKADSVWHNEGYIVDEIGPEKAEKVKGTSKTEVKQAAAKMRLCPYT